MFEALEARRLMSVVANFADGSKATQGGSGSLSVKGGSHGFNNLAVVENLNGVLGQGNVTVINNVTGEMADFYYVNPTKPVKIEGRNDGNVLVSNMQTLAVEIKGGSGVDYITVRDTRTGPVTLGDKVDAGKGNDNISLVASPLATLTGGDGDDVFNINTGAIDNAVIYDYDSAIITVNAGNGNDIIYIWDGSAKVDGGSGIDALVLMNGSTATYKNVETLIII